jgi:hypothetical protein
MSIKRLCTYIGFLILLAGIQMVCTTRVMAQKRTILKKVERLDSVLSARYYKIPYDTNYVVRPVGRWTLKVMGTQTGNTFHTKGTLNGITSKSDLSTNHKTTISLGASYRGLSASFSINPAKMKGIYKDYELNMNYFSSRISLDFSYQRSESLSGKVNADKGMQQLETGDVSMKIVNVAGYYAFNNRKFSFPAAFNQNYIQRRSAGSWLAGISYQGGTIKTTDELKIRNPNAPDTSIKFGHLGVGAGYGYNLVLGKKWLLHISALPTIVVYNRNKLTMNGVEKEANHMRFHMIFNERAAVIYNFSPRYFAGATLVMNNSVFDNGSVVINQNKWRARALIGVRL